LIIRLTVAMGAGLLLGLIVSKIGAKIQNVVPYLLFPLLTGGLAALTAGEQRPRPVMSGLASALAVWFGVGLYLLVWLAQQPGQVTCGLGACTTIASVSGSLVTFYVLLGFVLSVMGALLASLLYLLVRTLRKMPNNRI
jgi:hypothetical protein